MMAATAGRLLRGCRRSSTTPFLPSMPGAPCGALAAARPACSSPVTSAAWGAPPPGGGQGTKGAPTGGRSAGGRGPHAARAAAAAGGRGRPASAAADPGGGGIPSWAAPDRRGGGGGSDSDSDGPAWARSSRAGGRAPPPRRGGGSPRDGWRPNDRRRPRPTAGPAAAAERRLGPGLVALYGVNAVSAALASGRRGSPDALYVQQAADGGGGAGGGEDGGGPACGTAPADLARVAARGGGGGRPGAASRGAAARARLASVAAAAGVPVRWVDKHELNLMTDGAPHQGVVLAAAPLAWPRLAALPSPAEGGGAAAAAAAAAAAPSSSSFPPAPPPPPPVWLALDEVCDPQNLGAILRSAHFLGAAGVLLSPTNCAPPSPAVSKASAGALEWVAVHAASRPLPAVLRAAAEAGWDVVGAASSAGKGRAAAVDGAASPAALPTRPAILVLGSEGGGLRPAVAAACGRFICVERGGAGPGSAGPGAVDSLNVSAAAAVLLHRLVMR